MITENIRKSSDNEILNDVFNREVPSNYHFRAWDNIIEAGVTYFGYSPIGETDDSPLWYIKRMDETSMIMRVAQGSWDDKLTLIYE